MTRGRRESQWLVMRRCLALIRRVQRGPATIDELMDAVLAQEGPEAYGEPDSDAARLRLEKDLERIRGDLFTGLYFDREFGAYTLQDADLPLLDLPDSDLATMAWLQETFGPDSPQHREVHALLGRLRLYLAPERRGQLERMHTALVVDLDRQDDDAISPAVWEGLTRALAARRRIEFAYTSPQQQDASPRRHIVDPWERHFDPARGHFYLHGYCHYTDGPRGHREQGRYFDYRLGRISDLQLLPQKLPATPPPAHRYAVCYQLAPDVARLGISRHRGIEIDEVERLEDGGAVVYGRTESLFWAAQALLHYGPRCRVLGGPELLARVRQTVREMAAMYSEEGDSPTDVGVDG